MTKDLRREVAVEPHDYPQGWYHVYVTYTDGHRPAVVDLAQLAANLPHGSGIDADWHVHVRRNGDVCCWSEYHAMDENGFYAGWRTFRFTLARCRRTEYKVLPDAWSCHACGKVHYGSEGPAVCPACKQSQLGWIVRPRVQVLKIKGKVYFQTFVGGGDAGDYLYDTCYWPISDKLDVHSIEGNVVVQTEAEAKAMEVK